MRRDMRYERADTVFALTPHYSSAPLLPSGITFFGNEAHDRARARRRHIGTQTRGSESERHARVQLC